MNELGGLVLLIAGLAAFAATGALAACCMRLRSPSGFVLAAYLIAWTFLVGSTLVLSPARLLTRWSLLLSIGLGLAVAAGVWHTIGRPRPPSFRPTLSLVAAALRDPVVLVLAVAVGIGAIYVGALALLTPVNDWDALSYHLARAAFWKQEHGIAYIEGAADSRLNHNPPNASIGQLATMLLAGNDRYVAIPQLLAYAALVTCVAGLARRIGLGAKEATFAALAFATLPVIALQGSGGLNDLVVASFLGAAAYFALQAGRAPLVLVALAIGLAVGTKFTGLIALPTLALVAVAGRPRRHWPGLFLAAVVGLSIGSIWYVVNVVETGHIDGGAADEFDQQAELGAMTVITALRLAVGFVDMSGAPWKTSLLFLVGAGALAVVGLLRLRRSRGSSLALLGAAALTASVVAFPLIFRLVIRPVFKAGLVLDVPRESLERLSWALNTHAEPTVAWYGPLAAILLVAGLAATAVAWRRRQTTPLAVALAVAPLALVVTLALTLTWDPWRGRFLVFGVALAAATWGFVLRWRPVAFATAAIGSTALFLSLANYQGKPLGLAEPSIWSTHRWEAQTQISGPRDVLRFVEENVPEDARIGISLTGNHHLHPYFGAKLSRHVSLVPYDGGVPPAEAEWLVMMPETDVKRCSGSWQRDLAVGGWSIERRVAPDECLSG